jgi:hypothetical protein
MANSQKGGVHASAKLTLNPDHSVGAGQCPVAFPPTSVQTTARSSSLLPFGNGSPLSAAYIEPGSPWENSYCESFNGKLRDELLNGKILYTLKEAQIMIEIWRQHYNKVRPHSSLGCRPPVPEALVWPETPVAQTSALKLTFLSDHSMGVGQLAGAQNDEFFPSVRHLQREGDDNNRGGDKTGTPINVSERTQCHADCGARRSEIQ